MNKRITELKKSFEEAGVISNEDIARICELEKLFEEECEAIADECKHEGKPSYGSDFSLRCESIRGYYDQKIEDILEKYE